jgi:hypothetical protein
MTNTHSDRLKLHRSKRSSSGTASCRPHPPVVRDSLIGDLVTGAAYYEAVIRAFANLPAHDPILELMVNSHCHAFDEDQDNEDNGEIERRSKFPYEFLLRVMLRCGRLMKNGELARADLDPCNYHRHISDEEKELCQAKTDKKRSRVDEDALANGVWNDNRKKRIRYAGIMFNAMPIYPTQIQDNLHIRSIQRGYTPTPCRYADTNKEIIHMDVNGCRA